MNNNKYITDPDGSIRLHVKKISSASDWRFYYVDATGLRHYILYNIDDCEILKKLASSGGFGVLASTELNPVFQRAATCTDIMDRNYA